MLALVALLRTGARGGLALRFAALEAEVRALREALRGAGIAVPSSAKEPTETSVDVAATGYAGRAGQRNERATGESEDRAVGDLPPFFDDEVETDRVETASPDLRPPAGVAPELAVRSGPGTQSGLGAAARDALPPDPPPRVPGVASTPPGPPSGLAQIDWERWLGVRGAAVLGGAVLALAGLYFFRYSIEHGLIPPWLRVVTATLVGVAALAGAEWSLRRNYAATANGLAGGGLVVLYAAFWAAGALYDLIGPGTVFALMVAVTVTGSALSVRHDSLVIAVIGLVGGFLTPLFASSGSDRPIALFGYILLLDLGLMAMARRRRWPVLALLSFAGTAAYEVLWIGGRMDAERTLLGLGILALFALLFCFATPRDEAERSPLWRWSQAAGVLAPLGIAFYFAANTQLQLEILPLGALLCVLSFAAGWLARRHDEWFLALGAAAASVGVVAVWIAQHEALGGAPWTVAAVCIALAAANHAALELSAPSAASASGNAGAIAGLGLLLVLDAAGADAGVSLWPLLFGWLGIAALLVRQGSFERRGFVQLAAALGVALGLVGFRFGLLRLTSSPASTLLVVTTLGIAVVWQGIATLFAGRANERWANHAAAALALILLLARVLEPRVAPASDLGLALAYGFLILLAGTRLCGGPWLLAAPLATAAIQFHWVVDFHPDASLSALGVVFASAALFTLWAPLVAGRLRDDDWAWRAAALAGPASFPALRMLFEDRFGDAAIGLLPLALGAVALAAAARARTLWAIEAPRRTMALAWLCGAALGFVTIAVPLQLDRQWITIGWALEGAALVALWTRLDHPGLKYVAIVLLCACTVRLVGNEAVLDYEPRSSWRIVNWLAYSYLIPAAAMAYAARLLRPLEVARLRTEERDLYVRAQPIGAGIAGFDALAVVFVWLNLAIIDWYAVGPRLTLVLDRMPARDLTLSIAWALYALTLLALGVRLASGALRWLSLGLMMITIGKIFLYDLGELHDLYRVASLLGLAVSLLVVSLIYQRFVLRRPASEDA